MRSVIALILLVACATVYAQPNEYYINLEKEAFELADKFEYQASLSKAEELYMSHPELITGHVLVAFDRMNLNRHKDAAGYISAALAIDPSNYSGYFLTAYYYVFENDMPKAKEYIKEAIKLLPADFKVPDVIDEMTRMGNNTNRSQKFTELADFFKQQYGSTKERYPTVTQAISEWSSDVTLASKVADAYAEKFTKLKWPEMAIAVYGYAAWHLRYNNYMSESAEVAKNGYNYYRKNGYGNDPYQASFLMHEMIDTYAIMGNDEKVIPYLNEILALSDKLPIHVHDVKSLLIACGSYGRLNKTADAKRVAEQAFNIAKDAGYRYGMVSAANSLCASNLYSLDRNDIANAVYYGETANQLGIKYKYEELLGSIMSNLAIGYYKQGTVESQSKAIRLYGSIVTLNKEQKRYAAAATALNNLGVMMMNTEKAEGYKYAAEYFEESIEMDKLGMGEISGDDKLAFYQSTISAYVWLTACYAYLDNTEKVYETIEASRSRVLTERLAKGKDIKPGKISDLQRILQPDEAAIFYSLYTVDEVIILVVTKKYAKVLMHKDASFIAGIKEKYLDRINKEHGERVGVVRDDRAQMADFHKVTQLTRKFIEKPGLADDVLKEYLQGYYKFLILPVLNRLSGIKSLLISPDDVLNYIPFEALQMHNGKYLVENYNVRYFNSTGAYQLIEQRKYNNSRKPLMAMGGAVYETMNTSQFPLNTQEDLNALDAQVLENKKNNSSQRQAYASLFGVGPMNPLPGTLSEVQTISKYVSSPDVFSGRDFTENKLKAMSKAGELKKYKVLHLATHGFVVSEIPDLSGIAMSIFSNEQNGEDGFLNVNEIAALDLNADLAVLSACQTALGKIYSGEGVTGLTQSLLVAGSNAALVSLWPVNDTSTMLFMSDLYKESAKGKPYWQVMTDLKRKFIKGEYGDEFKHPNFWAPFIYFGK